MILKSTSSYSKTCAKNGLQDQLSLNAGQKCCRMLRVEHSAILLTFIKLSFGIKIFVLSIFSDLFTQVYFIYMNILEE